MITLESRPTINIANNTRSYDSGIVNFDGVGDVRVRCTIDSLNRDSAVIFTILLYCNREFKSSTTHLLNKVGNNEIGVGSGDIGKDTQIVVSAEVKGRAVFSYDIVTVNKGEDYISLWL